MPDWFTPVLLLLDTLAVYRITRLIVEDRVPFGPLRDRVCDRWPDSLAAEWFTCPWCCSPWIAAVVLGLHALTPAWWPWLAAALAFSAVAGLLSTWEQRN